MVRSIPSAAALNVYNHSAIRNHVPPAIDAGIRLSPFAIDVDVLGRIHEELLRAIKALLILNIYRPLSHHSDYLSSPRQVISQPLCTAIRESRCDLTK